MPSSQKLSSRSEWGLSRRALLAALPSMLATLPLACGAEPSPSPAITHRVYFDVGVCDAGVNRARTLGDTVACEAPAYLGRMTLGLYGDVAPASTASILETIRAGKYDQSLINKVLPGQYLLLGHQGPKRLGYVAGAQCSQPNTDLMQSASFQLPHRRPGTVSLAVTENEDEQYLQRLPSYCNVSMLITTGPGPVPSLDGQNVVIGELLDGFDVLAAVQRVPTFYPSSNRRAFNELGQVFGDKRANLAAKRWGRPLKPIVVMAAGEIRET